MKLKIGEKEWDCGCDKRREGLIRAGKVVKKRVSKVFQAIIKKKD